MTKYLDENDLVEFFGQEILFGMDENDKELGWYSCSKLDQYNLELCISMIMLENWYTLILYHKIFSDFRVYKIDMKHTVDYATRDNSTLDFYNKNNQSMASLSLHPNFSLKLPEIFASKDADQQMHFSRHNIGLLFECQPMSDHQGNISFSKTNESGFALFITIYHGSNKCFARLIFVHYQEPVFEVTFANIAVIDVDLTKEKKALIIKGKKDHEVVKILFDPTFSMELETWIFRD